MSTLAVIWIHTASAPESLRSTLLARFAVPSFAVILGYFAARSRKPALDYVKLRARTLYLPFLAWTGIYLALRFFGARLLGNAPPNVPQLSTLLTSGSAHHLWFLPFGFILSTIACLVRGRLAYGLVSVAVALGFMLSPRPNHGPLGYFLGLVHDNLLPGTLGVLLGMTVDVQANRSVRWLAAIVSAGLLSIEFVFGRNPFVECALGLTVFLTAATSPSQVRAIDAKLGSMSFGVYVVHIVFVEGITDVCAHFFAHFETATFDLTIFFAATAASTLATVLLQQFSGTQWLVDRWAPTDRTPS